jgi:hypothetical protein
MSTKIIDKDSYIKYTNRIQNKGSDGCTPVILIDDMVNKIDLDWSNPNLRILDPCFGFGGYLFFAYLKLKQYHSDEHILNNMLYGIEIEPFRFTLVKQKFNIKNLYNGDFLNPTQQLKEILNMKFDVILGNPPYQIQVGPNKTETIWDKFVVNSLKILKNGGYLSLIHPIGWRNVSGDYKHVQKLIKNNNLIYLNINDVKKGQEIFGKITPFDWFLIKMESYKGNTKINDANNFEYDIDISNLEFIPNCEIEKVILLLAKNNEEKTKVLYDSSKYETRNKHMNKEANDTFKYPCVYSITGNDEPNFMYSSINTKGHFGIPKLILGNGVTAKCFIDYKGEYGMTQFAYGIVDTIENLEKIKKVLENDEFQKINIATKFVATAGNPLAYPRILSTFRKDFWKEFI